jgi:cell wall-associated NlpC family hydrolase
MPSGAGRMRPSRMALLAGFGFALLALAIAAAVMLIASPTSRNSSAATTPKATRPAAPVTRTSVAKAKAPVAKTPMAKAPEAKRAPASTTATATAGTHRLIAEARDPEEAKSFPAPASVHHSAAKTPQAAGVLQVASGAASDAEVRAELAKMKQLESAATDPAKMATVPGGDSIVGDDGAIPIPSGVPEVIQRVIAGANAIANFPYVYGGGHASFVDHAYDCSGSVSYALAAGGLLSAPETSGQLESWGAPGPGKWITVYANAGHTYMYVNIGGAWMLFDTAGRSGVFASRWQPYPVDNSGYVARHWPDL